MQRNSEKFREIQRNVEKFREIQRNAEKCREMKRNVEKCREIQRNSEKFRYLEISYDIHDMTGMYHLISLNSLHLENIAHVGSYRNLENLVEF